MLPSENCPGSLYQIKSNTWSQPALVWDRFDNGAAHGYWVLRGDSKRIGDGVPIIVITNVPKFRAMGRGFAVYYVISPTMIGWAYHYDIAELHGV